MIKRWLSPSMFALAALCFVLPFATVSCNGASTSFSGIQLVTHTVPAGGVLDQLDCRGDIAGCIEDRASTPAEIALVAALLGLVLGVRQIARGPGWCAAVGAGALAYMPLSDFLVDIELHTGYVLALVLLVASWLLHVGRAFGRSRRARRSATLAGRCRRSAQSAGRSPRSGTTALTRWSPRTGDSTRTFSGCECSWTASPGARTFARVA